MFRAAGTRPVNNLSNDNGMALTGKRVLILFPHFTTPGGAGNYALKMAEILAEHGATVGVLTMRLDSAKFALPQGVEMLSLDGPVTSSMEYWTLFPFWQTRISRRIAVWHPDVLLPQIFPANWWGWLYKMRHRGTRLLWVCHEPSAFIHSRNWIAALEPFWKRYLAVMLRPLLSAVDRYLSRFCDMVAANSLFTASQVESVYGVKPAAVAYPAIDFNVFQMGELREKSWEIITVAKLSRFKRVDFLLRVFARVLRRHPHMVYHIVGQGEDEWALRALAGVLGVASRVLFHGALGNDELVKLHRRSMLFLHGSVGEPFGMAPLEAIACGTPVVSHNSGGPREFINDACGRLVDSLEEGAWIETISSFLTELEANPSYFDRVAEQARKFEWEVTLRPLLELIGELCGKPS